MIIFHNLLNIPVYFLQLGKRITKAMKKTNQPTINFKKKSKGLLRKTTTWRQLYRCKLFIGSVID